MLKCLKQVLLRHYPFNQISGGALFALRHLETCLYAPSPCRHIIPAFKVDQL